MAADLRVLSCASLPNTCQYDVKTDQGDFLVQVAWPMCWSKDGIPPAEDSAPQTVFLVDGNAYFFSAVDITRRMEYLTRSRTVVVGFGYPDPKTVYDYRRGPDLTPASVDGTYEMPLDRNGKPRTDLSFGKAAEHLELIKTTMDYVFTTLFPLPSLRSGRKALFGHSYGAIFALHTLFTARSLFDAFIVASPILWWNNSFLTEVEEPAFQASAHGNAAKPGLYLSWGGGKQNLVRRDGESDLLFQSREGLAEDPKMADVALALARRLENGGRLKTIVTQEFPEEDHGTVAATSLQAGIVRFLRQEI